MTISSVFSEDEKVLTIEITDSLHFDEHKAFRATYANRDVSHCILNLEATSNLNSAALGMLLLLKDALDPQVVISILNCNPQIRNTLFTYQMDRKFSIE